VSSLKGKIVKAVEEFNKYRAPEAVAKFLTVGRGWLRIEFTGPFWHACGFYDYFDDLKIFPEEIGAKTDIAEITEISTGAVVRFIFTNQN
jgi:hypothetical protein